LNKKKNEIINKDRIKPKHIHSPTTLYIRASSTVWIWLIIYGLAGFLVLVDIT
jgi:hypothetical protein